MKEEIKGRIQITFEGKPIQNLSLLVLRIVNDGTIPVTSSDFEEPLSFSFGDDAIILSAEITDVVPRTLKPTLDVDKNHIVLRPLLLNSRDTVSIKLLFTQYAGSIQPYGRIVGVNEVTKVSEAQSLRLDDFITTAVFVSWFLVLISLAQQLSFPVLIFSMFSLVIFWFIARWFNHAMRRSAKSVVTD